MLSAGAQGQSEVRALLSQRQCPGSTLVPIPGLFERLVALEVFEVALPAELMPHLVREEQDRAHDRQRHGNLRGQRHGSSVDRLPLWHQGCQI